MLKLIVFQPGHHSSNLCWSRLCLFDRFSWALGYKLCNGLSKLKRYWKYSQSCILDIWPTAFSRSSNSSSATIEMFSITQSSFATLTWKSSWKEIVISILECHCLHSNQERHWLLTISGINKSRTFWLGEDRNGIFLNILLLRKSTSTCWTWS